MMKVSVKVDVTSVQLYPPHLPTLNTRPPQRRCLSHILHLRMQGYQVEDTHGPARAGAELSAFGSESSSSSARPHQQKPPAPLVRLPPSRARTSTLVHSSLFLSEPKQICLVFVTSRAYTVSLVSLGSCASSDLEFLLHIFLDIC